MAARERDGSSIGCSSTGGGTAVAPPLSQLQQLQHKPPQSEIRTSAFRRGAGDFEERQMPAPRRFGFGTSPPRRNNSTINHNGSSPLVYDRSPPRSGTIMTPRSSSSFNGGSLRPSSSPPPRLQQQLLQQVGRCSTSSDPDDRPPHPVFSQLALVLGFELAKRVTERHPLEMDLNRLANLALDISLATAPAAAPTTPPPPPATDAATAAAAAAAAASRSGSATSQASSNVSSADHQRQLQQMQQRRRTGGGSQQQRTFNRAVNRSPNGSAHRPTGGFNRSRATAQQQQQQLQHSDDSFVTAVSVVPPSASRSAHSMVDSVRTDCTASSVVNDDLIDWDSDANPPDDEEAEEAPPSAAAAAPAAAVVAIVSHLLD